MEKFDLRVESNNRRKEGKKVEKRISFFRLSDAYYSMISPFDSFFLFLFVDIFEYLVSNVSSSGWIYISGISGIDGKELRESNSVLVEFNCGGRFARIKNLFFVE